jgi:hypothetical protein
VTFNDVFREKLRPPHKGVVVDYSEDEGTLRVKLPATSLSVPIVFLVASAAAVGLVTYVVCVPLGALPALYRVTADERVRELVRAGPVLVHLLILPVLLPVVVWRFRLRLRISPSELSMSSLLTRTWRLDELESVRFTNTLMFARWGHLRQSAGSGQTSAIRIGLPVSKDVIDWLNELFEQFMSLRGGPAD